MLICDKSEKSRPYLQISNELIKSTLACLVLRNVGSVGLTVKSIRFNDEFINQLPERTAERLKTLLKTNINIFPERFWAISLDVNYFEIINNYDKKEITLEFNYTKINKKREYVENISFNFAELASFIIYISEIDEFKQEVMSGNRKLIKEIEKSLVKITKLSDMFENRIPEK